MRGDQLAELGKAVFSIWPRPEASDESIALWMDGIKDLPYELTKVVILELRQTEKFRPAVSDIRREAFGRSGLLPPGGTTALATAIEWVDAIEQRSYFNRSGYNPPKPPQLHPLVERVLKNIDTTHPSWRATFRNEYRRVAAVEVKKVIRQQFDTMAIGDGRG